MKIYYKLLVMYVSYTSENESELNKQIQIN